MNSDLSLAAQRGWKIFPLLHSSRFAVRQPLLHHATSNEAQVERWENQYPEYNWAVATGKESGVFAIKFSLDTGLATMREFGERDPETWHTLQVRGPNEILTFLEWPAAGLPISTCSMIAPGARLLGEESYIPIPGPGMRVHPHCEYVDREAPALPVSEWLMERIHQGVAGTEGSNSLRLTRCRMLPSVYCSALSGRATVGVVIFTSHLELQGFVKHSSTVPARRSFR
jgi:hypothetical protein